MSKHTEKCCGSAAVIFLLVGNFKKKKREKQIQLLNLLTYIWHETAMCFSKGVAGTHSLNLYLDPGPDPVDLLFYFHSL